MKVIEIINTHTTDTEFFTKQLFKNIKIVSEDVGNCVLEMKIEECHQNIHGTLHGGLSSTLIDDVSHIAMGTMTEGKIGVTVDLSVKFLSAAKCGETILIDARTVKIGKRLAFVNCDILEKTSGKIVAQGRTTLMLNNEKDVKS